MAAIAQPLDITRPNSSSATAVTRYGVSALVVVLLASWLISVIAPSKVPFHVADGFTVFALLYIVSQAVERFIEPFSCLFLTASPEQDPDIADKRTFVFWAITAVLGMIASAWFGIYLLSMVLVAPQGDTTAVPRYVDILTTGIVIGGGAKGVHDLLSNVLPAKK